MIYQHIDLADSAADEDTLTEGHARAKEENL